VKTGSNCLPSRFSRRAFTLVEMMFALIVGLGLSGTIMLLLVQAATEQKHGYADTTVEEKAYTLKANLTSTLRSMSASYGMSPVWSSATYSGATLLGYQSISIWYPSNGSYTMGSITYYSLNGNVVYTPNVTIPSAQIIWMSNTPTASLTQCYFNTSSNPDSAANNSLVNVVFQMNDNGFSQQGTVNNPTTIFRNFSVQMRNDN